MHIAVGLVVLFPVFAVAQVEPHYTYEIVNNLLATGGNYNFETALAGPTSGNGGYLQESVTPGPSGSGSSYPMTASIAQAGGGGGGSYTQTPSLPSSNSKSAGYTQSAGVANAVQSAPAKTVSNPQLPKSGGGGKALAALQSQSKSESVAERAFSFGKKILHSIFSPFFS